MPKPVDDRLMWEEFVKDSNEKQQILEEGLWDRVKARGAGAIGSIKGLGKRVSGAVKSGAGAWTGNQAKMQAGAQTAAAGAAMGLDAKTLSLANNHMKKIKAAIADFQNDMTKLGLDTKTMQQKSPAASAAIQALNGALNNLISRLQPAGQVGKVVGQVGQPAATAAPAAPAAP